MKTEKRKHLTTWQTPAIVLEHKLDGYRFKAAHRFFYFSNTLCSVNFKAF